MNYTVPTSELIKEYIIANGYKNKHDAWRKAGYKYIHYRHFCRVIQDKKRITKKFSRALEVIFPGTQASFWINVDKKYREFIIKESVSNE